MGRQEYPSPVSIHPSERGATDTNLKPIHRTSYIADSPQQPISVKETRQRYLQLASTFITDIDSFESCGPELNHLGGGTLAETQTSHHSAPNIIDNKARCWHRPLLIKGREQGLGIPRPLVA